MIEKNELTPKRYFFRVGNFVYHGTIIDDNDTHWIVQEDKEGIMEIPKTAIRKEVGSL